MKNIEDIKLKNLLSNIEVNPDPEWVTNTRNNIIRMQMQNDDIKPNIFNLLFNFRMNPKLVIVLGVSTLVALSGGTFLTVKAAEVSKPGDFLFGLNKAIENVQRSTINDPQKKAQFESEILKQRVADMESIQEQKDANKLKLAVGEVSEQEDNFLNSLTKCGKDCDSLDTTEQEDIHTKAEDIKDDATKNNNDDLENEASKLADKTKSSNDKKDIQDNKEQSNESGQNGSSEGTESSESSRSSTSSISSRSTSSGEKTSGESSSSSFKSSSSSSGTSGKDGSGDSSSSGGGGDN